MLRIHSIDFRGSVCDGPGLRTVLYLQGCRRRCAQCHNQSTWDEGGGTLMDIATLADSIRTGSVIRRLTITGGEPLDQYPGLYELVAVLSDFDLALYTGYEIEEVPAVLIPLLNWIKVGRFEVEKRTTVVSYFGSTNQRFLNCRDILLPSYQDMRNEHKQ